MCGEATTTSNQGSYSNSTLPQYLEQASHGITKDANAALASGYQGYTGPTTGAFGSTFGTAENAATQRAGTTDPDYSAGTSSLLQGLGLAGTTAATPVTSLMNPYVGATLAPTLDAIQRQAAANNSGLATNATMAGAFGDTGYGTAKATNDYNTTQAIGNATGSAYSNAYNTALGAQQTALSQLLGGVGQASTLGSSSNTSATNLEALLGTLGSTTQQANQTGINTAIGVNNQNQMGALQQAGMAAQAINQAPHDSYTQGAGYGQQTQPDNTGWGLLGSLLSGVSINPSAASTFGGFNYGSPDIAQAAQAGVASGLTFNPLTGSVE